MGLGRAIAAELVDFEVCGGVRLRCYRSGVDGGGERQRPLVLLHSINAAPSAMEMKPLFMQFAKTRPVFAPDLPGFGLSQRGDLPYSSDFFAEALADLLGQIGGPPPDVVALSLTSEFIARAILEKGAAVHSLTLISPTGMGDRQPPSADVGARINKILNVGWLGNTLWWTLVSRPSIRLFLGKAFYGRAPKELVDYAAATAREPGANRAPFAFLTMQLFSQNALTTLYAPLKVPTLLLYDQDPNVGFEQLPDLLAANPAVSDRRITPTMGLPHWERPTETFDALAGFWDGLK